MSRVSVKKGNLQLPLVFPAGWGGSRRNAGRKHGPRPRVPHRSRSKHHAWQPVHITLRARLASLRSQFLFPTIRLAIVRATRRDPERFRVVHFSVQRDHVHLVVEAVDQRALSSGVSGLMIRVARYVNEVLSRRGSLWADRFHGRALKTPREVRSVIVYVLANARKHARVSLPSGIDPYSLARWFGGFFDWRPDTGLSPPYFAAPMWRDDGIDVPTASDFVARTWLCRAGWRRGGLIAISETPSHRPHL